MNATALECASDPVMDALDMARKYMVARENLPMPEWLRHVEDAIGIHRARHAAQVAAIRGLLATHQTDYRDAAQVDARDAATKALADAS